MSNRLPFDIWLSQCGEILKAIRIDLSPVTSSPKWAQAHDEGLTPLEAVQRIGAHLFADRNNVVRAKLAAERFEEKKEPDYLDITRSIAGG